MAISALGTLPIARLRVIGDMAIRFWSESGPSVVSESSKDIVYDGRRAGIGW
jgi:hypothetical protein